VRHLGGAAFVLAGALAACDAPRPAAPDLWTLFDVQALYGANKQGGDAIAVDAGLPGGVALEKLLAPTDRTTMFERGTLVEGYPGSYLTTEVWSQFDEVWLQPMYIPVVGWEGNVPQPLTTGGSTWIFSVGPGSRFYSPFWQMVYFDVPVNTPPDAIKTARDVLDGKYPLHFGPGRTVALVPGDVVLPALPQADPPPDPPIGPTKGTAWLDGQQTSFVDFGKATFTWNEEGVIDEVPIYVLLMRSTDGRLVAPDIRTVAGTGPPGSRGPVPPIIGDQPRYAAYWRLYTVTLPADARVFSPSAELQAELTTDNLPVITQYSADAAIFADTTSGWVALNPGDPANGVPGCFDTAGQLDPDPTSTYPDRCVWLSSQAAIEANIDPSAIQRTDVTVTCPFVTFQDRTVSPIK
jgi:hypothetical protein